MTIHHPIPQPAAKPRPLPAAAAAHAGAAGSAGTGAAGGGFGDKGRRGVLALVLAGMLLGAGLGGSLYMSAGGGLAAGSAPVSPASPPAPAPVQAAASASPDSLAAGISTALRDYQCAVSPGAGGKVLVPSDFGRYSCVIISATSQSQAGGGFVAPCVSADELQQYLDAKHGADGMAEAPSCLPSIVPSREAELRPLGCQKLSYFFSSGRKYLLCN